MMQATANQIAICLNFEPYDKPVAPFYNDGCSHPIQGWLIAIVRLMMPSPRQLCRKQSFPADLRRFEVCFAELIQYAVEWIKRR